MSEKKPDKQRISSVPPFGLRMLPDLRQRLEEAAEANERSLNSEIVARLEDSLSEKSEDKLSSIQQTAEMSMLTMLNFIEIIMDTDETGTAVKEIAKNVRAQFRKDHPDHPLLKTLTEIDRIKEAARERLGKSKKP